MTDDFLAAFEARRTARQKANRSFPLAGEILTFRPSVAPEVGLRLEAMRQNVLAQMKELRDAAQRAENGDGTQVEKLADAIDHLTVSDEDMLQVADETILACLEPESHEAWARLRSNDAPQPLVFDEVFEIADYLLGRVAGVPTDAPADSSAGRTETARPSKGRSSSPAKTPTRSR